jgi:hypothetical protein
MLINCLYKNKAPKVVLYQANLYIGIPICLHFLLDWHYYIIVVNFLFYLLNHPLMATQKSTLMQGGRALRVELEVYNSYEIKREILGYGKGVKVVSPESLVNDIKEMAQGIINQYK